MTITGDAQQYIGRTAVDAAGERVGKIGQVYLDDTSGEPVWVTVSTGLFGARQSFAPLQGATLAGDDVQLPVTKAQIKDAPNVEDDAHISESEQDALYQYYSGLSASSGQRYGYASGGQSEYVSEGGQDYAATGDTGVARDDAMTRSEERLRVGKETVETGRVRLRKYIVTEQVTQTVPVSHEEVRIEREPITDANRDAALTGADLTEDEHEVVLHAERAVVDKEVVPVERVRLSTETVTGEEQVSEELRKERIEQVGAEGVTGSGLTGDRVVTDGTVTDGTVPDEGTGRGRL